jgi:hypothetical protein
MNGLSGEKVMPQIHVLGVVPVLGGDVGHGMALVIGRVIDQDRDRAKFLPRLRDRGLQRHDVGHVAPKKKRCPALALHRCRHCFAFRALHVDESDARVIAREGAHKVGADAGRAAAYEHIAPGETGIDGEGQAALCGMSA